MEFLQFKKSLDFPAPPPHISDALLCLWYDGKGDWNSAHNIAQDMHGKDGEWLHAYLHRKEGDLWNADYWYRRAGKKRPDISLQEEWEHLARYFSD